MSVGSSAPSDETDGRDRAAEEAAQQRLAGRVGRVGDDGQAAADDRALPTTAIFSGSSRFGTSVAR